MADFVFPQPDTGEFEAPNGLTYAHDGVKWVVKSLRGSAELKDELDDIEVELRKLELSLEELSITKGSVARYTVKDVNIGIASRNGELYVNAADAASVTAISFAPFDLTGQPTRPTEVGDIIEFVEATRNLGEVTRYRITSGTDPQALTVEYLSGNNDFEVDENEEVYIYPQNEESASKDYVDTKLAEKVNKIGDEMKGALVINNGSKVNTALEIKAYDDTAPGKRTTTFKVGADGKVTAGGLIKTTRDTGYAWQIKPNDGDATSWFHTNGTFHLGGNGSINGDLDLTTVSNKGLRILGNFKIKAAGEEIGGNNNFEVDGTGAYYNGVMTQSNSLITKKYVDDAVDAVDGGGAVEVYNGPNPPGGKDRGTLLLSSNNALYIYM